MDLSPGPFFGRQPELAALGRLFRSGQPRLIAITGPAGAGKSRLARQAASTYAGLFREICFLDLAKDDPDRAAFSAAAAVGLLVLDGLDGIPDGGRAWLEMAPVLPAAQVLITARCLPADVLKLRLDGLPVPPDTQHEALGCCASVALFVAAARQEHPGYTPDQDELERAAACCRAVGGLPGEIVRAARGRV